jgi:LDH2 family malate/lactate/ureidoglycolate dehydrogenase
LGVEPHRSSALDGAAAVSTAAARTRGVAVVAVRPSSHGGVLVPSASGPRVRGCPRPAPRYSAKL